MRILEVLQGLSFGQRVAEEETDQLAQYFVETDQWRRLFSDEIDVVYGPKGSGKSALYSLLRARQNALFDRRILLVTGENPRGSPAFKALVSDPPSTEQEFVFLWKLYVACLLAATLEEYGIKNKPAAELRVKLEESGLRARQATLQGLLQSVFDYVKRTLRSATVEGGLKIDPATLLPTGVTAKISFSEPSSTQAAAGSISVDQLMKLGDEALQEAEYSLWILLDRLDVAFSESSDLEHNALRALFHVYLDALSLGRVRLKIFLRSDIWNRITTKGFREASHITRHLTIDWDRPSLLNLVVRRAAQNTKLLRHFAMTEDAPLVTAAAQAEFANKLFPDQVEIGPNKPQTFDWMLGRTRDGSGKNAPRELIHLLNSIRDVQIKKLELGESEPEGARLFARNVFKEALPEVSKTRLHQTLYAEYPEMREHIERLRGEKTQHSVGSLAGIWKIQPEEALSRARQLVEMGFFEQRGTKADPVFWVPLLYRDALDLVQGAAE